MEVGSVDITSGGGSPMRSAGDGDHFAGPGFCAPIRTPFEEGTNKSFSCFLIYSPLNNLNKLYSHFYII